MPSQGDVDDVSSEDSALDASAEWGTMVWRDLVDAIDARYRTLPVARHRAVGGISMGGFGALNLALRHRDRFGAVTMWSGYVVANTPEVDGPIGSASWRRRSPLLYTPRLAASLAARPLAIDFYSGDLDPFVAENLRFHRLLAHLGIPHRFDVPSGGHTWAVWRAKLPVELAWVSSRIG